MTYELQLDVPQRSFPVSVKSLKVTLTLKVLSGFKTP